MKLKRLSQGIAKWRSVIASGALGVCLASVAYGDDGMPAAPASGTSLEQMRLQMDKWIETQQIISRERKEWQQAREILAGRLELVKKEIHALEEKIAEAQTSLSKTKTRQEELLAENRELTDAGDQLQQAVGTLEQNIHALMGAMPEPVTARLQPLLQRMPAKAPPLPDPAAGSPAAAARVSIAERFQTVLGMLNEMNKANSEISVNYEVRTLSNGKPTEVKAMYLGLAQGYYVSAGGESGVGQPFEDSKDAPRRQGWVWKPNNAIARDVLTALEIIQGKQSPEFIPLPVTLQ